MRNKFSLIELISVIAIMVIIMAITLPAFLTMTKGQSVELAAREIGSKLKAVRSYAITNRVYCALVFPTAGSSSFLPSNYFYRSYKAFKSNSLAGAYTSVPDEKWEFLPTGVVLQDICTSKDGYVDGTYAGASNITVDNTIYKDIVPTNNSLANQCIIFKPTGDVSGSDAYLVVGEGTYTSGTKADTHNAADVAIIKVDKYTGRVSYGNQ